MKFTRFAIAIVITVATFNMGNAVIRRMLIDFTQYEEKVREEYGEVADTYIGENELGNPVVVVGYNDYMLDNWKVDLNPSANFLKNRVLSQCRSVRSRTRFNADVLGVRIHFPTWPNNSYALVKPPFPIQVYAEEGGYMNVGNGVIPNSWEIKSMSIWVNGRNYNNQIAVRLRDRDNNIHEYFMGSLYFEGWRRLMWINPNFTENVFAKTLSRTPLYPRDIPYLVFDSIVIYRQGDQIGGDFVTYVANIEIEYTPYVVDSDLLEDIDDEEIWQIITERGRQAREREGKLLTEDMLLYQQERHRIELERDDRREVGGNNEQ